jgi:hypothetical protein
LLRDAEDHPVEHGVFTCPRCEWEWSDRNLPEAKPRSPERHPPTKAISATVLWEYLVAFARWLVEPFFP